MWSRDISLSIVDRKVPRDELMPVISAYLTILRWYCCWSCKARIFSQSIMSMKRVWTTLVITHYQRRFLIVYPFGVSIYICFIDKSRKESIEGRAHCHSLLYPYQPKPNRLEFVPDFPNYAGEYRGIYTKPQNLREYLNKPLAGCNYAVAILASLTEGKRLRRLTGYTGSFIAGECFLRWHHHSIMWFAIPWQELYFELKENRRMRS